MPPNEVVVVAPAVAHPGIRPRKKKKPAKQQNQLMVLPKSLRPKVNANLTKRIKALNVGRMSGLDRQPRVFCSIDRNEKGWFFKVVDPAGAVETARAVGSTSKIPDGLTTFSVDAEIRVLENFSVPGAVTAEVDLSGKVWSFYLISYPLFRVACFILANRANEDPNDTILGNFCEAVNNMPDYRQVADSKAWQFLTGEWYWRIVVLPPMYDLPDPSESQLRTVTDIRITYKSITVEDNSPNLLNQGWWTGGNYALTPAKQPLEPQVGTGAISWLSAINMPGSNSGFKIVIRNLAPASSVTLVATGTGGQQDRPWFAVSASFPILTPFGFDYVVPDGITWTQITGAVFAIEGDVVSFRRVNSVDAPITISSSSSAFVYTLALSTTGDAVNTVSFSLDSESIVNVGGQASVISLPAINTDQIASNNFKMEQFLMKESRGAYLVPKKMRNPVYQFTNMREYGPIQLSTPGYSMDKNHLDGSGLLDSVDANFSTIGAAFKGISWANSPVLKIYQGWEGVTNVHTTFGQFGHSGLPKNEELLNLVDCINTLTTGIYPARDNFIGAVAAMAAKAFKALMAHEATSGMIRSIGTSAVKAGAKWVTGKIANIGRRPAGPATAYVDEDLD